MLKELRGPYRKGLSFVFLHRGCWRLGVHRCHFLSQEMGLVGSEAISWLRPATDERIAPPCPAPTHFSYTLLKDLHINFACFKVLPL